MAELPFLKNKNKNSGGGGPIKRDSESASPAKLIDSAASEFLDALIKRDRASVIQSLRAFVMMAQSEDLNSG